MIRFVVPVAAALVSIWTSDASAQPQQAAATATAAIAGNASIADVGHGTAIYDPNGDAVGQVESAEGQYVTIIVGDVRTRVAVSAFNKRPGGVSINATAAKIEQAMRGSSAAKGATAAAPQ